MIVSTTKFRNDTLLAVKYVAGAVLLSQLETFLHLVTHNESVHCGISFEIFLPVHSQTKFLFCHKLGFTCCTIASILILFGCLPFVVVVVVFHSSKICIQLLPFCVVLFLLLIIINLMYILLTIQL